MVACHSWDGNAGPLGHQSQMIREHLPGGVCVTKSFSAAVGECRAGVHLPALVGPQETAVVECTTGAVGVEGECSSGT